MALVVTTALILGTILIGTGLPATANDPPSAHAAALTQPDAYLVGPPAPIRAHSHTPLQTFSNTEWPATTWHVCPAGPPACDYAVIQDAVDVAGDGDSIKVATGVYTGTHSRPGRRLSGAGGKG
jgi:hypothetical protein